MTEPAQPTTTRPRSAWSFALIVLAGFVALFATLNVWVERQLLDTDAWVDATDQLLADDDVRGALATYLVNELYDTVPVGERIGELLPEDFANLGPLLAGALREPATETVDRLLESDAVRVAWREANRAAHQLLVAVIEDDTGDVLSTAGGAVSIDLRELVRATAERIGFGEQLVERLPDDAGVVVLFESDELETAQDAARIADRLAIVFVVVVVVLFAAALYLSAGRRRTLRDIGIALTVVGAIAVIGRIAGVAALADSVSKRESTEPASSVLDIGTTLLRQIALTEMLVGLVLIGFATLVGPSSFAHRLRAHLVPVLRHGALTTVGGGVFVFLVLLWIKPGGPIESWLVALVLAVLCVAGVWWVQRVSLAEAETPLTVTAPDPHG
jgi:hypothetical protein